MAADCAMRADARLSEVIAHKLRTHVPVEVNAVARPEDRITVCNRQGFLERFYPEGCTPRSLQTECRGLVCLCIAAVPQERLKVTIGENEGTRKKKYRKRGRPFHMFVWIPSVQGRTFGPSSFKPPSYLVNGPCFRLGTAIPRDTSPQMNDFRRGVDLQENSSPFSRGPDPGSSLPHRLSAEHEAAPCSSVPRCQVCQAHRNLLA